MFRSHREREARLRQELELHLELATEANIRRGMMPDEARRAARIALGATEHFKEEARDQFRSAVLASLAQDLRCAARAARRAPWFTGVAILTLAVAFALTTSAFVAVNGVLIRALPYPEAERLALVWGTVRGESSRDPVSFTNAMDWKRGVRAFESLATFSCTPRPILGVKADEPSRVSMMDVSEDFFHVLRARPQLGRLFGATDYGPGVAPVVVLADGLWRTRFGSSSSVVGSRIMLDGQPVTVAGVLAADYSPLPTSLACRPELYHPLASRYDEAQRTWSFLKVVARLEPSASIEQAQAQLDVVNARLADSRPTTNTGRGGVVVAMRDYMTRPLRPALVFVQTGAILVLLIACANVASLLAARATVRRRELSIRVALGASRRRLVTQIATECLLLGVVAAALGIILTVAATGILSRLAADTLPDPRGLAVDWRVVVFAAIASLAATTLLGLAAVAKSRGDGAWLLSSLRDGARGGTMSRSRLARGVVVVQLALAMLVVVSAGLLARSYRRLRDVPPGFDPTGVLTARVTLPDATYPRGESQERFFQDVLARLTAHAGVVAAGAVSILPESPHFDHTTARVIGRRYAPSEEPTPDVYRVTPGYFAALGISVKSGRTFAMTDDEAHPLVAVINETMAKAMFPGVTPVGQRIWTGAGNAERTIVGVVGDAYQYGLDSVKTMQLYVPHADNSGGDLTLVIKSAGRAGALAVAVREAVRAVDPGVPVDDVVTMDDVLAASGSRRRTLATLSLVFALGAIALAAVGLCGLTAYSTAQRTHEFGVRFALGATIGDVVGGVVIDAARLVAVGLTIGTIACLFLARLITPLLFGVTATDPFVVLAAVVALALVATAASAVPASRVGSISPLIAIRHD
jgi:putative ABC transport system permease protein